MRAGVSGGKDENPQRNLVRTSLLLYGSKTSVPQRQRREDEKFSVVELIQSSENHRGHGTV